MQIYAYCTPTRTLYLYMCTGKQDELQIDARKVNNQLANTCTDTCTCMELTAVDYGVEYSLA
jgi:hypothetical protein